MGNNETNIQLSLGSRVLLTLAGCLVSSLISSFLLFVFSSSSWKWCLVLGCISLGVCLLTSRVKSESLQYGVSYPAFLTCLILVGFSSHEYQFPMVLNFLVAGLTVFLAGNNELRQLALFVSIGTLPFIVLDKNMTILPVMCLFFSVLYVVLCASCHFFSDKVRSLPVIGDNLNVLRFSTLFFAMVETSRMFVYASEITLFKNCYIIVGIVFALMVCAMGIYLLRNHVQTLSLSFYVGEGLVVLMALAIAADAQISLAILALIFTFYASDKRGLVLSIIFLLLALVMFYYSTEISLLYKSISLMVSGAICLSLFYFLKRISK